MARYKISDFEDSFLRIQKNIKVFLSRYPVALAESTRTDLLIPVGQIRDADGKIVGAKGLARLKL